MKQLTKHIIQVHFISPETTTIYVDQFNAANIEESRRCGREIAAWLARGVEYRVDSSTIEIERK